MKYRALNWSITWLMCMRMQCHEFARQQWNSAKESSNMSSCGVFYGQLDFLVSTPTSQAVSHRSSHSSSTDSSRSANSSSVARVTPSSTLTNISRANNCVLEHKINQLLDAIEVQKRTQKYYCNWNHCKMQWVRVERGLQERSIKRSLILYL